MLCKQMNASIYMLFAHIKLFGFTIAILPCFLSGTTCLQNPCLCGNAPPIQSPCVRSRLLANRSTRWWEKGMNRGGEGRRVCVTRHHLRGASGFQTTLSGSIFVDLCENDDVRTGIWSDLGFCGLCCRRRWCKDYFSGWFQFLFLPIELDHRWPLWCRCSVWGHGCCLWNREGEEESQRTRHKDGEGESGVSPEEAWGLSPLWFCCY